MYENLIWKNILMYKLTKFTEKHGKKENKKYCTTYSEIEEVIDDSEFNIVLHFHTIRRFKRRSRPLQDCEHLNAYKPLCSNEYNNAWPYRQCHQIAWELNIVLYWTPSTTLRFSSV